MTRSSSSLVQGAPVERSLLLGESIKLQFFANEALVETRLVNANHAKETKHTVSWLEEDLKGSCQLIGVDLEWIPELGPSSMHAISLIQISTENRIALFHTQGRSRPNGAKYLQRLIDSKKVFKSGVGTTTDLWKLHTDIGTQRQPHHWYDMQKHHTVISTYPYTPSFNVLVEEFIFKQQNKTMTFSLATNHEQKMRTTFSNWNQTAYTLDQVKYSAFDAYASRKLYLILCSSCKILECSFCDLLQRTCPCGITFSHLDQLSVHQRLSYHGVYDVWFSCECKAQFRSSHELLEHQKKLFHGEFHFPCTSCNKVFATKSSLSMHQAKKQHGTFERYCSGCDLFFANDLHLLHHQQTFCAGTSPILSEYSCASCGEQFSVGDDQEDHENYLCSVKRNSHFCIGCGKTNLCIGMKDGGDLQSHWLINGKHKPKCRDCGFLFFCVTSLKSHQKQLCHGKYKHTNYKLPAHTKPSPRDSSNLSGLISPNFALTGRLLESKLEFPELPPPLHKSFSDTNVTSQCGLLLDLNRSNTSEDTSNNSIPKRIHIRASYSDVASGNLSSASVHTLTDTPETGESETFICSTCNKRMKSKSSLEHHEKDKGHGKYLFQCEDCSRKFHSPYGLQSHQKCKFHGRFASDYFECSTCGLRFTSERRATNHEFRNIHGRYRFTCNYRNCTKIFRTSNALRDHQNAKHNEEENDAALL